LAAMIHVSIALSQTPAEAAVHGHGASVSSVYLTGQCLTAVSTNDVLKDLRFEDKNKDKD